MPMPCAFPLALTAILAGALALRAAAGQPEAPAPSPPARLEARADDDRSVSLRWERTVEPVGLAGYEVLLHDRAVSTKALEIRETGLEPGRTYCYVVRTVDARGERSAPSSPACARTPDLTPPSTPAAPSVALRTPTVAVLGWPSAEDDVGVVAYELLRDGRLVARTGPEERTAEDGDLRPDAEPCWTVRALDAAGNASAPSARTCLRTPAAGTPSAPGWLVAEEVPGQSVELRWDPSPSEGVVYVVYGAGRRRLGLTPRTSFTVPAIAVRAPRCFQVAAVDEAGRESPPSPEACVRADRTPAPVAGAAALLSRR